MQKLLLFREINSFDFFVSLTGMATRILISIMSYPSYNLMPLVDKLNWVLPLIPHYAFCISLPNMNDISVINRLKEETCVPGQPCEFKTGKLILFLTF